MLWDGVQNWGEEWATTGAIIMSDGAQPLQCFLLP